MENAATQEMAKAVVAHDPVFINTIWGAVTVYGHELVSKKDLVCIAHCLTIDEFGTGVQGGDHGVRMIILRDDGRPVSPNGVPLMAACAPEVQAIGINLAETFRQAVQETKEDEGLCIRAAFHRNLILNMLHEIHHLDVMKDVDNVSDEKRAEEELMAEEWALNTLYELGKLYDIEPAHPSESSFLAGMILKHVAFESTASEDEDWQARQQYMLENSIMFHLPETAEEEAVTFMSFKMVLRSMADGKHGSKEEWEATTILGAGEESALSSIIRAMDDTPPVELPPTTVNANTEVADVDAETAELINNSDPNLMGYGGFSPDEVDNDMGTPVNNAPMPMATPTPNAPLFPVSGQAPAAPYVPPAATAGFPVAGQPMAPAPQPAPQAQVNATQTTPVQTVYPATGLNPEQTGAVVFGVFDKIYQHIFTYCGRMLNSDQGFATPEAVGKSIQLTEQEMAVVVKCDCIDENGRWCPNAPTTAGLRGYLSKGKLPFYKIYINNDGYEAVRLLMPQNPGKVTNGQYSKPALQARGGSCIMYVKDVQTDQFVYKCIDNAWQAC